MEENGFTPWFCGGRSHPFFCKSLAEPGLGLGIQQVPTCPGDLSICDQEQGLLQLEGSPTCWSGDGGQGGDETACTWGGRAEGPRNRGQV